MADKLEFIDGKFMRNGVVEAPKFGDKDQLEALNNLNNVRRAINDNEYELPCWDVAEDDADYFINFRCYCGRFKRIYMKQEVKEVSAVTEYSPPLKLSLECVCGLKWKATSLEGFFYNFKITK